MKSIVAVIQPFMLSRLTQALEEIPSFPGMTVVEVQGFGREKALHLHDKHSHLEEVTDFTAKVRLEIVSPDDLVEQIVEMIVSTAHTGNRGDGKIFIMPAEDAISIRSRKRGAV